MISLGDSDGAQSRACALLEARHSLVTRPIDKHALHHVGKARRQVEAIEAAEERAKRA